MSILSIVACWIIFGLLVANVLIDMTDATEEQTGIHLEDGYKTKIMFCGSLLGPLWFFIIAFCLLFGKRK